MRKDNATIVVKFSISLDFWIESSHVLLVRQIVPHKRLLHVPPPQALAPPGPLSAHLHRLQDEALRLHDVEEQLPDHVGDRRVR